MRLFAERSIVLTLLAVAISQPGCLTHHLHSRSAASTGPRLLSYSPQAAAKEELARASALEKAGDDACVDAYFQVCSLLWQPTDATDDYTNALSRLLSASQHFGRLNPSQGLMLSDGRIVPIVLHGFPWSAQDFQRLHCVPTKREPLLNRRYACHGIGLPLVVERCRNNGDPIEARFFPEKSFFAATAVLRFSESSEPLPTIPGSASTAVLDFYNPLHIRGISSEGDAPLSIDTSAPLALTLEAAPRTYLAGFIEPGTATTTARLNVLEPYQPSKVPVVLVHGLFSDPLSWADMINDLRAVPDFTERYQLWVFRYPTGQGFLQSAAALRRELTAAVAAFDPSQADAALQNIVLVGHSMGGLISKLQVTYSDELIWSRVANRPLDEIATTEPTRALLTEACYFDPTPHITRVIFIATPHQGSLEASGLIGHTASLLVEPSAEQAAMQQQLIRDNPDTFNSAIERRFPTSIDMLTPRSPLLAVMRQMRLNPCVKLHNVIGVSHPLSFDGSPSDGIVSVNSATHPGCLSVLAVNSKHAVVHRTLKTSYEVLRILNQHHCSRVAATGE